MCCLPIQDKDYRSRVQIACSVSESKGKILLKNLRTQNSFIRTILVYSDISKPE